MRIAERGLPPREAIGAAIDTERVLPVGSGPHSAFCYFDSRAKFFARNFATFGAITAAQYGW